MLVIESFQKFAGIPSGISRIFVSFMQQQIGVDRRKNRSIQVQTGERIKIPGYDTVPGAGKQSLHSQNREI
jgi:hypothetical protein